MRGRVGRLKTEDFSLTLTERTEPMANAAGVDLVWWISAIEIPVVSVLFWLIWRLRQGLDALETETRLKLDRCRAEAESDLAAYKLDVAQSYVSMPYMKDVERRLTHHLLRIEVKLDARRPSASGDDS